MNYRHAYHAGSHTDVFKHAVLAMLLEHLRGKPKPFTVLDTHAGAGRYDLTAIEAGKTGEAADGIGRVIDKDIPAASAYLGLIRHLNPDGLRIYPGSPAIIAAFLRDEDRLIACELHEEEAAKLRRNFRGDPAGRHPPPRRLRGDRRLRTASQSARPGLHRPALREGRQGGLSPACRVDECGAQEMADRHVRRLVPAQGSGRDRTDPGRLQSRQPGDAGRRVPPRSRSMASPSRAAACSSPTRLSASRQGSGRSEGNCSPLSTHQRAASPSTGGTPRPEPHPVARPRASNGLSRPGSKCARSTWAARPSRISSAIASPVAGALSMPQTLWPVAT